MVRGAEKPVLERRVAAEEEARMRGRAQEVLERADTSLDTLQGKDKLKRHLKQRDKKTARDQRARKAGGLWGK